MLFIFNIPLSWFRDFLSEFAPPPQHQQQQQQQHQQPNKEKILHRRKTIIIRYLLVGGRLLHDRIREAAKKPLLNGNRIFF